MRQTLIETNLFDYKIVESNQANLPEGVLLRMGGLGQRADERNQNGRVYSETLWDRVFNENGFWERVKGREMLGEADHPEDGKTSIPRVSHLVTEVNRNGKEIMVEFDVLDTPCGRIVETLVKAGARIGISSRGTGSVIERGGETYVNEDDFELETWDIVTNPSTRGAYPQRLESANEDNAKIILGTAERLCESDIPVDELRAVQGFIADLKTERHHGERQRVLQRIQESIKQNEVKEKLMGGKEGISELGDTLKVVNELAKGQVEEANKKVAEKDAQIAEMSAREAKYRKALARLREQSKGRGRRRRFREADDDLEDMDFGAEVIDEPTTLEVDGVITILPDADPGVDTDVDMDDEEMEDMPERRRRRAQSRLERKRQLMRRKRLEQKKRLRRKRVESKRGPRPRPRRRVKEGQRRRRVVRTERHSPAQKLRAAKRVIEKQHRELTAAKKIIETMVRTTVPKKKYEQARVAVAKTLREGTEKEIKQQIAEKVSRFDPKTRKQIIAAIGPVKTLKEANLRLDKVLALAQNRKTGQRKVIRETTSREPLPGQRISGKRQIREQAHQQPKAPGVVSEVVSLVEKKTKVI